MRLIDADALRKEMYHEAFETDSELQKWDSGCWIRWKMFENFIQKAPIVDAAPVKHGRWEDYGHCSCCGWGWSDLVYDRTEQMSRMNYCPYCGACMDLEEQDAQTEQSGK